MVYKLYDKQSATFSYKSSRDTPINDTGTGIVSENQQLTNKLHIIRRFTECKVYSSFKGNIWGVNVPNMQSISKYIDKDAKFKVADHVRISKCKNMFAKTLPSTLVRKIFCY